MRRAEVVQWGPDRLRVAAWRGSDRVAVLTPLPGRPLQGDAVAHASSVLAQRGVEQVLTAAIPPDEQQPFLDRGFTVRERLHLLERSLGDVPATSLITARIRRGWRRDLPGALEVDALAFTPFWRFDRAALVDARNATPSSQLRVAEQDAIVGYAITGRAEATCYLQRLAVHPGAQRAGIGTALVLDALAWARDRRATRALVNTQIGNLAALGLYERLGFVLRPDGLAVLERSFTQAEVHA